MKTNLVETADSSRAEYQEKTKHPHTPGPWQVIPIAKVIRIADTVKPMRHIADVVPVLYDYNMKQATMESNAQLIAAAPDLLEALRTIVGLALRNDGDTRPLDSGAICHTAWDAIAKATNT